MKNLKKLVLAALFLALAYVMPFLTGQIPQFGSMLLPMHLPVLLCGFICGWPYALAVGLLAPLTRHLLLGMPPLMTAICMSFELAAYGALTGIFYHLFPKKTAYIYVSLILAMLGGRIVWGLTAWAIYPLFTQAFTWQLFAAGAFLNAIPGMIVQLALIPVLVLALRRAKVTADV
ncbi:MAG: ECF transporter S component [Clostridiaceae bacterium]|nr:ECF transporter S component [Clostridiaceae bacterium]